MVLFLHAAIDWHDYSARSYSGISSLKTCRGDPQAASCEQQLADVILCRPAEEKVKTDAATAVCTRRANYCDNDLQASLLNIFCESANVSYCCSLAICDKLNPSVCCFPVRENSYNLFS